MGEANGCQYCLSAHSMLGKLAGLQEDDIAASREAASSDPKTDAALKFARTLVGTRGQVGDDDVRRVREVGYTEGEVAEIIAAVALNVFTNYFNVAADVEVDFPPVAFAAREAR